MNDDKKIAAEFLKEHCLESNKCNEDEILYAARLVTRAQQIKKNKEVMQGDRRKADRRKDETKSSDL